ncbi:unnamed protein product [Eruca vesicaria subsp. sativa]|uniref:Uncharacterized protein n=1 Tax=Eruca vesicaria subsp. sativa TaxID=29727 RepID=A0ABC8KDT7_ERUVS|nr:unnamed protein product [Eruca vesicaria subsp. sativa]
MFVQREVAMSSVLSWVTKQISLTRDMIKLWRKFSLHMETVMQRVDHRMSERFTALLEPATSTRDLKGGVLQDICAVHPTCSFTLDENESYKTEEAVEVLKKLHGKGAHHVIN